MSTLDDDDRRDIREEFHQVVNMAPSALRRWLESETSRSVGMTAEGEKVTDPSDGEAVGHAMGKRIWSSRGGVRPTSKKMTTKLCARSPATSTGIWVSGQRAISRIAVGATR